MAATDSFWTQRIRDPVHGLVVFGDSGDPDRDETDRIAWNLLNTPEFQRLRRIRQLGFSDLVFPGATHSRFAHSIGVYHMARRLADVIARREGRRDPDRERVALLAALLHDIGHGPFSHAFEAVVEVLGRKKRHEDWSAEIIRGDTEVNKALRSVDEELPQQIGEILTDEHQTDIYSTIVSSQFDADRLDYIQRDRLMVGVEFGHIDLDWLFDCLEVGAVTVGSDNPVQAPCLYLGPKGVHTAEEYLEARSRLYRMVYMHKTTRAAEKMLQALLSAAASGLAGSELARREPVLRYLASEEPTLGSYLALDDSTAWSALTAYSEHGDSQVRELAERLRNRDLYKCVDVGIRDVPDGNLLGRFNSRLKEESTELQEAVLFDDVAVASYRWYDFSDTSALNKVLVKTHNGMNEPADILGVSDIVKTLRGEKRIQRAYVPNRGQAEELERILEEAQG